MADQNFSPQVTVDSTGLATAVWVTYDESMIIQSSSRPRGGGWSTPIDLSLAGKDSTNPQVTVDSTGLATAVWSIDLLSTRTIQSSSRPRGGSWSTPIDLSLAGKDSLTPQVTVDSTGLATAVWQTLDGSNSFLQSSSFITVDETPTPTPTPTTLANTGAKVDWLIFPSLIAVIAGAGFLTFSKRKHRA